MRMIVCVLLGFWVAATAGAADLNWRKCVYEPETPRLESRGGFVQAEASDYWGAQSPMKAIDGDTTPQSHWACERWPAVLTLSCARKRAMNGCRVWFYYGDRRVYKFYVERSVDGRRWERVADWTRNGEPSTSKGFWLAFKPGQGKFLRFTVVDSSVRKAGAHIVEVALDEDEKALHGRVAELERIDGTNAAGEESKRTWRGCAWRNERVHGQFVVWANGSVPQLRLETGELKGPDGARIPADALSARFVRYVLSGNRLVGDILDTARQVDLPAYGFRPVWLTVKVPADTRPGVYRGALGVRGMGDRSISFPIELEVLDAALPDPSEWTFDLDIWQHPWAIARYHGVEPFSPAHYALMEPIYRELASAGQKAITATITDLPWNHQNFDPYLTMVEHLRQPDGSWKRDFSLFDAYVEFCRGCGLGPQIHCYTMVTWGNRVYYREAGTGDKVGMTLIPGTAGHEAFWGAFLSDFQKHLESKGWLDKTYIAMDERGPRETLATVKCIQKYAPALKVTMAGNRPPSAFKGIALHTYSQSIGHVDDAFLKEVQSRRAGGKRTTFYVCCGPARHNTFTHSPLHESTWLPLYAAANGFDGFLRWAFVNWPRDPLFNTAFGNWPAGDTFFVYPGPRLSLRWEMLRDGIEEFEKVGWLRKRGADMKAVESAFSTYDFRKNSRESDAALADQVRRTRRAIEQAARAVGR